MRSKDIKIVLSIEIFYFVIFIHCPTIEIAITINSSVVMSLPLKLDAKRFVHLYGKFNFAICVEILLRESQESNQR